MNLGSLLRALDDEGHAASALDALGDVVLLGEVHAMREVHGETPGAYVANAARRFAARASDDDWLALMTALERDARPGLAAVRHMVRWAVAADVAEQAAAQDPARPSAAAGCGGGACGCGAR